MSSLRMLSLAEILKHPRPEWSGEGGWTLDRLTLCLILRDENGDWVYDVDLQRCRTSAGVLDWILQVADKAWATDAVVAGLVRALGHYLSPQATLCSFGQERGPLDVRALLRQRVER